MADAPAPAPGRIFGLPIWLVIVGAGGVALWIWHSRQAAAASSGAGVLGQGGPAGGGVATPVIDPNTGQLIDPLTGNPIGGVTGAGQTLAEWATAAEKALVTAGISPALAAQAIFDYTSGNSLSSAEGSAVNKALGLIGFPPVTLPFNGTIPGTGPQSAPPPVPTRSPGGTGLTPIQALPAAVLAGFKRTGEYITDVVRTPQYGAGAGYYLSNKGGVFAVGGAPYEGSYLGLPAAGRSGQRTPFTTLTVNRTGYTIGDTGHETYAFGTGPGQYHG